MSSRSLSFLPVDILDDTSVVLLLVFQLICYWQEASSLCLNDNSIACATLFFTVQKSGKRKSVNLLNLLCTFACALVIMAEFISPFVHTMKARWHPSFIFGYFHSSLKALDKHKWLNVSSISFCLFLSVSELLMGEVDSSTLLSVLPTEKSRVREHVRVSASVANIRREGSENETVLIYRKFVNKVVFLIFLVYGEPLWSWLYAHTEWLLWTG